MTVCAHAGVCFAVPLRHQTILREKLKFPSGTASAHMIATLHRLPPLKGDDEPSAFEVLPTAPVDASTAAAQHEA